MRIHNRTVIDRVFEVWRSPDRFTKNPDVVRTQDGRLLLVYSDTDKHWSIKNQVLTILESRDDGATWRKLGEVDEADLARGDERLVTPRLSALSDGRLAVIVDHDDDTHFHEDQSPGNWIYWSSDGGKSWSEHQNCGVGGIEPDRIMELPDGRLAVCSHIMRGQSQEFAEIMSCSDDDGATWYEQATVAHDGYHRFCEGALVVLDGAGSLACVMRENHSAGIPSFVAFSADMGRNWGPPQMLPFSIHRPYAKQLRDGRVLVTGRHVNGGLGTYAWCGDLHAEAGTYQIGGPRRKFAAEISSSALTIQGKPAHECRYTLLPPEGPKSDVVFEAELKVDGPEDEGIAFLSLSTIGSVVLTIGASWLSLGGSSRRDMRRHVDFTSFRRVSLRHRRGLLSVDVDGETVIYRNVYWEQRLAPDHIGGKPTRRTQFGQLGDAGRSMWRSVSYDVKNPTLGPFSWSWHADSTHWPDQYQRDRLIQIHGNHPDQQPNPDHGYSSWLVLPDDRIFFVDYTNLGDRPEKSHLVGTYLTTADLV